MNSQRWLFTCLVASSSCHGEQVISTLLAKIHSLDLDPFAGLFGGLSHLAFHFGAEQRGDGRALLEIASTSWSRM